MNVYLHPTDLSYFRKALELYHSEHKEALVIQQTSHLGLLLVDKTELKEKLVSSPLQCLEVRTTEYEDTYCVATLMQLCTVY